jgi:nitrogen regulatory protein P-II 1
MKLVIAYIKPERLNQVKQALYRAEVFNMSVTNALGCGKQKGFHEHYRGVDIEVNLLKKVRLEIAVNENFVEPAVKAIMEGAKTGQVGDGKIFIVELAEAIRISSEERGGNAVN